MIYRINKQLITKRFHKLKRINDLTKENLVPILLLQIFGREHSFGPTKNAILGWIVRMILKIFIIKSVADLDIKSLIRRTPTNPGYRHLSWYLSFFLRRSKIIKVTTIAISVSDLDSVYAYRKKIQKWN
jgi:hypothetical protein